MLGQRATSELGVQESAHCLVPDVTQSRIQVDMSVTSKMKKGSLKRAGARLEEERRLGR